MLVSRWDALMRGRVNPLAPAILIVIGIVVAATGSWPVGLGLAVGGLLAYLNGLILSKRVDLAALSGNVGTAMLIMQFGLLIMLTIVAVATYALVRISIGAAVACAAGFVAAQLLILGSYYRTHGRTSNAERGTV